MNKCKNCGHEFEGKFCPECGTRIDGGASVNTQVLCVVHDVLKFVPLGLMGLLAALAFAFFAAPLAGFMGLDTCTVYTAGNEIPELKGSSIATIVITAIFVFACVSAALIRFLPRLHAIKFSIFGLRVRLSKIAIYICYALCLALFIMGCVLAGKVASLGMEAGAAAILIIVFTILFGILSAAAEVCDYLIGKRYPDVLEKDINKIKVVEEHIENHQKVRAIAYKNYVDETPVPQKPKEPDDPSYKLLKKSSETYAATIYFIIASLIAFTLMILSMEVFNIIDYETGESVFNRNAFIISHSVTLVGIFALSPVSLVFGGKAYRGAKKHIRRSPQKALLIICLLLSIVFIIFATVGGILTLVFALMVDGWSMPPMMYSFIIIGSICGIFLLIYSIIGLSKAKKCAKLFYGVKKVKKDTPLNPEGEKLLNLCNGMVVDEKLCREYKHAKNNIYAAYGYTLTVNDNGVKKKLIPDAGDGTARYRDEEGDYWSSPDYGKTFNKNL